MAISKQGTPFLFDEVTGDIVGIKDNDGSERYFGNGVQLDKLNRAFSAGALLNPESQAIMTTPPTISQAAPAAPYNVPIAIKDVPSCVRLLGGQFIDYIGQGLRPVTTTRSDGSLFAYSGSYEFITDAPIIVLSFLGPTVTARFSVDGQYVSKTSTNYTSGSEIPNVKIDFAGVRKSRRITVYSPTALRFIYTDAASRVTAPAAEDIIRAVVTGDSYTAAVGAQFFCADAGWSQVMCKYLGIKDARSCGVSGSGYVNPGTAPGSWKCIDHIGDITSVTPDIVIFAHGANDFAYTPAEVKANAMACFASVRWALRGVPIVVLGPWPLGTGPSAGAIETETAIAAAVTEFNDPLCKYSPVINEPSGSWIFGQGKVGTPTGTGNADFYLGGTDGTDGTHANDAGHLYLGIRAAQAVMKAVSQMNFGGK